MKPPWKTICDGMGSPTIVFCGCNFPNCPRTWIYEASERDFWIVLAEDAISGLYEMGREELENIGVRLMTTAEIVEVMARLTWGRAQTSGSPKPRASGSERRWSLRSGIPR